MTEGEVHTMDAVKEPEWLTREQIDSIVAAISADDLIESGLADAGDDRGAAVKSARNAFNFAAETLGLSNGTPASKHVRPGDLTYWTNAISEAVNVDGPKVESTKSSQGSVTSGE